MSKINGSLTGRDLNFPGFDEYDIISGSNFLDSTPGKIQKVFEDAITVDENDSCISVKTCIEYHEEWNELYGKEIDTNELRRKSLDGRLWLSRFRSIYWRCLLGILHNEPKQWLLQLKTYRNHYNDLWIELRKNPWNVEARNPSSDNPLSQDSESIWQKHFSNEELKSVIHQDVVRTFPGEEFFRDEAIHDLMVRVLFCYARQNPTLCYRQGMHEILAPLIYVLHCDHDAFLSANKENLFDSDITEILNPKYMEEDAYSIFKHIMNHIECSYRINNLMPNSNGQFPVQFQVSDSRICENEVINKLQYIKEHILKTNDPDLNKHLDELDIPLHLFGIRWLRLLFGPEFPFQDLLVLWDAIFAVGNFELVNYIVVAMLTAIRSILIASDYTTCLTNLMRYPSGVEVMFVVKYALHLMDPSQYAAPTVTSFSNKPLTLVSNSKSLKRISADRNHISRIERSKILSSKSTNCLTGKSQSGAFRGSGDYDGNVMDGLALDDPKILQFDLEHLSSTINLTRVKLIKYYNILACNLPESSSSEVKRALNGIHELCEYLNKYGSNTDIEPAHEAGEVKQPITSEDKLKSNSRQVQTLLNEKKAHTLPKAVKKLSSGELKVFKQCYGGQIIGAPMMDPVRRMISISYDENEEIINPSKS